MSHNVRAEKKAEEDRNFKVSRYRAGKAPQWSKEDDGPEEVAEVVSSSDAHIKIEQKYDPRLARLQKTAINQEDALNRRRQRHEEVAEIVSTSAPAPYEPAIPIRIKEEDMAIDDDEEEMDEEEAAARRERARLAYLRKREAEEEEPVVEEEEGEEEEEEEGSEYETDSDYDEFSTRPTIQPVFVSKKERATIEERDRMIEEEEKLELEKKEQLKERKLQSEKMLKDQIAAEEEAARRLEMEGELEKIDSDEEEEDEAKEYELWKQREISRIKRDREERDSFLNEKEETAKRRNMSDLEIRQIDKEKFTKNKKKWNFMQKYYHTGAFFREGEEEDIQKAMDFSLPVGEDHIDKTALPKVMQVKNFGRSGQTKYTHLLDQDTTKFDAGWMNNDELTHKFTKKLGGMHGGLERPAGQRKR